MKSRKSALRRWMLLLRCCAAVALLGSLTPFSIAWGAAIIVNEYNAVAGSVLLKNNARDTHFGRVAGNGGDWFELVVIQDHLDLRGWQIDLREGGNAVDDTLVFADRSIWSDLRSGTIITFAEDVANDFSYNPLAGDWWINVRVNGDNGGTYITATNIKISSNDTRIEILDTARVSQFGPAGESVIPAGGVGDDEIWKLEAIPSTLITPNSNYNSGTSSTFGAPNIWSAGTRVQDFSQLRSVVIPEPGTIVLLLSGVAVLLLWRRRNRTSSR